jgi:hypothetical protein
MIHPTDRLFRRTSNSMVHARMLAGFIRNEVDLFLDNEIPVASAYFQREDISYRLTDKSYCLRNGVINIPAEDAILDTIIETSQCDFELSDSNPSLSLNFSGRTGFKVLEGVPKPAILQNYPDVSNLNSQFRIYYQIGAFPEDPYDGWSTVDRIVDKLFFPSIAKVYNDDTSRT